MASGQGSAADDAVLLMSAFQSQSALSRVAAVRTGNFDVSIQDATVSNHLGGVATSENGVPLTQWMVDSGWSCVHAAVWYEDVETINRLCRSIAVDVNKPTFTSVTPLRLAIEKFGTQHPIVRALYEAGGHPNISRLQAGLPAPPEGSPAVYAPNVDYRSTPTGFAARIRARKQYKPDSVANVNAALFEQALFSGAASAAPSAPTRAPAALVAPMLSAERSLPTAAAAPSHTAAGSAAGDPEAARADPSPHSTGTAAAATTAGGAAAARGAAAPDSAPASARGSGAGGDAEGAAADARGPAAGRAPRRPRRSHDDAARASGGSAVGASESDSADDDGAAAAAAAVANAAAADAAAASQDAAREAAAAAAREAAAADATAAAEAAAVEAAAAAAAREAAAAADAEAAAAAAAAEAAAAEAAAAAAETASLEVRTAAAARDAAERELARQRETAEEQRRAAAEAAAKARADLESAARSSLAAVEDGERAVLLATEEEEWEDLASAIRDAFAAATAAAAPEANPDTLWTDVRVAAAVDGAVARAVADGTVPLSGRPDAILRALVDAMPSVVTPGGVLEPVAYVRAVYAWMLARNPFSGTKYAEAGGRSGGSAPASGVNTRGSVDDQVTDFFRDTVPSSDPMIVASAFTHLLSFPPTSPACSRLNALKAATIPATSRVLGSLLQPPLPSGPRVPFAGAHAFTVVQVRTGGRIVIIDPVLSCGTAAVPLTGRSSGTHTWQERRCAVYFDAPMDVYLFLVAAGPDVGPLTAPFGSAPGGDAPPAVLSPAAAAVQETLVWLSPQFLEAGGRVVGGSFHVETGAPSTYTEGRAHAGCCAVRLRLPPAYRGAVVADSTSPAPRSTDAVLHISGATITIAPPPPTHPNQADYQRALIPIREKHPLPSALAPPSADDVVVAAVAREAGLHLLHGRYVPPNSSRALVFLCAALIAKQPAMAPLSRFLPPPADLVTAHNLGLQLWSGLGSREEAQALFAPRRPVSAAELRALGDVGDGHPLICPVTPITLQTFAVTEQEKVSRDLYPQIVSLDRPPDKPTVSIDDEDGAALLWHASLRVVNTAVCEGTAKPQQWWATLCPLHGAVTSRDALRAVLPSHTVADPSTPRHLVLDNATAVVRRVYVEPALFTDAGHSVWNVSLIAPPQNGDFILSLHCRDADSDKVFKRVVSVCVRDLSTVAPSQDYFPPIPPWMDLYSRRISILSDIRWIIGTSTTSGSVTVRAVQDLAEHRHRTTAAAVSASLLGTTHDLELDVFGPEREHVDNTIPEADSLNKLPDGPPMLTAGQCLQPDRDELDTAASAAEIVLSHGVADAVEVCCFVTLADQPRGRDDDLIQVWCVNLDVVESAHGGDDGEVPLQAVCSFYMAAFIEFNEKPPQVSFLPGITEVNLGAAALGALAVSPMSPIYVCHPGRADIHRKELLSLTPPIPDAYAARYFSLGLAPAYDRAALLADAFNSSDVPLAVVAPTAIARELVVVCKGPVTDFDDVEGAPSAPPSAYTMQVLPYGGDYSIALSRVTPPRRGRYVVLLARAASGSAANVVARWQVLAASDSNDAFVHSLRVPNATVALLAPLHAALPVGEATFAIETENVTLVQVKLVSGQAVDLPVQRSGSTTIYGGVVQLSAGQCSLIVHSGKSRYEVAQWTVV